MPISYDDLETKRLADCAALIVAIRGIRDNWQRGDLAGAVNMATELADEVFERCESEHGEDQRTFVDFPPAEDSEG